MRPSPAGARSDSAGKERPASGRLVPVDRLTQAGAEVGLRSEAELTLSAGDVEAATRLAVRLGGVELDLAGEAGQLGDQHHQIPDHRPLARAERDWLGP